MEETVTGSLRPLEAVSSVYILPDDPLAEEVLIPGFRAAERVDCMVGFFSSKVLATLAPGLASYIAGSSNSLRLVISPLLQADDQAAIRDGLRSAEEVADSVLSKLMLTEDCIQQHTLKCLSWLLREGRIEIKVALMQEGLFHMKVWLFKDGEDILAVHGSSNLTDAGMNKNIEHNAIAKSWQNIDHKSTTDKFNSMFARLWNDQSESCEVINIPEAIRKNLLKTYYSEMPPTEDDFRLACKQGASIESEQRIQNAIESLDRGFAIPKWLEYTEGKYSYQGDAVDAWCNNGYQGILEMATGSGKTITSLIGAHRLYSDIDRPLIIVIAAPYIPLIEQWCEEVRPFGLEAVNLSASRDHRDLQRMIRRLRTKSSKVEVVIVTHITLCSPQFLETIGGVDCPVLLIADEVHNLGKESFIDNPPDFFDYRLGLSATPERQYDERGTDALLHYFNSVVFKFPLERAIGNCLVEYEYYVHPVYLTEEEMDSWLELTGRIKLRSWQEEDGERDEYLMKLLLARRALLETAVGKLSRLASLIEREDTNNIKHTLIYATDKNPEQMEDVNRMLLDKGIIFHQITEEETRSRKRTQEIIKSFQDGNIQVLTAKRVLDEGVNIPQVSRAYILASTTVERQWIQRRGRLLRTCDEIGKTHSIIHDFIALPSDIQDGEIDPDARKLVSSELKRVQQFARLSMNAGREDGALMVVKELGLVEAAYL